MNPMNIMAQAEKLGIPELQRSIQDGVVPAFIGVPLLQEKVKRQKQMQMGMAAQQPKRPSVAEQVGQEAHQASVEDMMRERARMMQGEMGQTGGISNFLPKPEGYADGGIITFDEGGSVSNRLKYIREHGLAGTIGGAYKQAYGWSSDLANAITNPDTYRNTYEDIKNEYGDLDAATKKILWGAPDEQQSPVPATINAGVPASDITKDLIRSTALPQGSQAMADRIASRKTSTVPSASFDFANPNQVATDVLADPVRANTDPDLWKWATEYRAKNPLTSPVMGGNAPAPTQTPYTQAAAPVAPATQTQPAQEEKDQSLADYMKQYRDVTGENKGISALQSRLAEREGRLARDEERAPWLALMQAGLATMAGTSPNAMANIGQGGVAGLQAYTHSMNKLEDAKDKSFEIQAKLEEAQRNEELAAAKYGLDSVQADKKAKLTAKLEREKMAHDLEVHKLSNATHIQAAEIQAGATRYSADIRNAAYGDRVKDKGNITQYQYGQLVDKASDNVDKMIEKQMLGFTMSPEELSAHRQRMIEAEIQRMVGGMGGGMMPTQPVAANAGVLPGYKLLSKQ